MERPDRAHATRQPTYHGQAPKIMGRPKKKSAVIDMTGTGSTHSSGCWFELSARYKGAQKLKPTGFPALNFLTHFSLSSRSPRPSHFYSQKCRVCFSISQLLGPAFDVSFFSLADPLWLVHFEKGASKAVPRGVSAMLQAMTSGVAATTSRL